MKITDKLGRQMVINIVVPGPRGWMTPLGYNINDVQTYFSRVPHGHYGIQVISPGGAELIVHVNGDRRLEATVPGGVQILEFDKDGRPFNFGPEGACAPAGSDASPVAAEAETGNGDAEAQPFEVPRGHGLVFIVARFAQDNSPVHQPPRQEYLFAFQMNEPSRHDQVMAGNLRRVVQTPAPPDLDDLLSHNCSGKHTPGITCLTCGRQH